MSRIGKVIDIPLERDFEWKIENFSTLSAEVDTSYESPLFYFANASWYLEIYPNGENKYDSIGYIGVYLIKKSPGRRIRLDYSLILKTMDERTDRQGHTSHVFRKPDYGQGWPKFLKRSEYLESRSELGLPDDLTFICTMKYPESTDGAWQTETVECSYCEKPCAAETISFHEGKCLDKPIKCPECGDVIQLRDWNDHQCEKSGAKASEKLPEDFKAVMLSGDLSDILIKVKGEEFPLHRTVLAARNSYFHSMFTIDMKEKNTGVVSIDDCEPEVFRTFVHFIYTGKVDKLKPEMVCELYELSDKYQEDQLKKECLDFMMKMLSEDTFCDLIIFSLKYDEKKLFQNAVELFTSKPNNILSSVKWLNFVEKYPIQANELFLKVVNRHVK